MFAVVIYTLPVSRISRLRKKKSKKKKMKKKKKKKCVCGWGGGGGWGIKAKINGSATTEKSSVVNPL